MTSLTRAIAAEDWGYHRQGYCQAGFSSSINKVSVRPRQIAHLRAMQIGGQ